MAVSAEVANSVVADFNQEVHTTVQRKGMEVHRGKKPLENVENIVTEFEDLVMSSFTQIDTTASQLETAKRHYLRKSREAITLAEMNQKASALGMIGAHNKSSPADSEVWNPIISYAAREVDRIGTTYGESLISMPDLLRKKVDSDLSAVLDGIEYSFHQNPSPENAEIVMQNVKHALSRIEKNLDTAAKAKMKAEVESMVDGYLTDLREREIALSTMDSTMSPPQSKAWKAAQQDALHATKQLKDSNYLIYDKDIRNRRVSVVEKKIALLDKIIDNAHAYNAGLDGTFSHPTRRVGRGKIFSPGHSLGAVAPIFSKQYTPYNKAKPPGFSGFAGSTTIDQIEAKQPLGTSKEHVFAMEYYMTEMGLSFEEAKIAAKNSGYPESLGGGRGDFY